MSQDAKHPGKVGQPQTMINTALQHLLEGSRGVIASQPNYFGLESEEREGGREGSIIL